MCSCNKLVCQSVWLEVLHKMAVSLTIVGKKIVATVIIKSKGLVVLNCNSAEGERFLSVGLVLVDEGSCEQGVLRSFWKESQGGEEE